VFDSPRPSQVTERFSTTVDGFELSAEQIEGGWRVCFGSKVGEDKHIDHAVAKATGTTATETIEIVRRLFPPPT
jgi:phage-related protein